MHFPLGIWEDLHLRCLVPGFDGVIFSAEWKEALADYVKKQQSFRGGVGYELSLAPAEEAQLGECLQSKTDPYSLLFNNCGTPITQCMRAIGKPISNSILPVGIGLDLDRSPWLKGKKVYPSFVPRLELGNPDLPYMGVAIP